MTQPGLYNDLSLCQLVRIPGQEGEEPAHDDIALNRGIINFGSRGVCALRCFQLQRHRM